MGNSASSGRGHHEETVDFGFLTPQGIYTGNRDWNQTIVAQLICERKLAPFYRPLEDYDESWDDEQILAHRKELPDIEGVQGESSSSRAESVSLSSRSSHKRGHAASNSKDIMRYPEAAIYRGAVECPICFLYYPPNINHSRCCDQAICTECFVQIKRAEPDPKHLVSEPASCPYCVQENFGVVYTPPSWRTGLGSEGATPPSWPESPKQPDPIVAMKRPRKSFGADSPEVVTIDQIRPDWEAKLAAVRAAVARRANRRIIMRQVGDRLIPVGISSGRVHPLPTEEGQIEVPEGPSDRGSRRSRRRQPNQDFNQMLGAMGLGGQDLEELMVMEAMRLSLLEHEEQQRKAREEEEKKKAQAGDTVTESRPTQEGTSAGASSEVRPPEVSPSSTAESASTSSVSVPTSSTESAEASSTTDATSLPSTRTDEVSSLSSTPPITQAIPVPDTALDDVISNTADTIHHGSPSPTNLVVSPADEGDASRPRTPSSTAEPSSASVHASGSLHMSETRPIPFDRNNSMASSFAPSTEMANYDMLSSSPESAISHKPLLRSRPNTPPVVSVESAETSAADAD